MSSVDLLERELTAWFADTAAPGSSDLAEDVLIETRSMGQRPRWLFVAPLPRPMGRPLLGHLRWASQMRFAPQVRLVVILAILGLLVLAAAAVWVGSRPRLPAPFGMAANGLVAYEKDGDIFTVDPETGERRGLVVGAERDVYPRWSLDGTHLAFIRCLGAGQRLIVVDAAGLVQSVSGGAELADVDPDGIAWSPDGRTVALTATAAGHRSIVLVDALNGASTVLPVPYWGFEAYWRPPDGRELLFVGGPSPRPALFRYSLDDQQVTEVPGTAFAIEPGVDDELRPIGWTSDGSRFAYHRMAVGGTARAGRFETHVVEVETGDEVVLDVGYGRISNDGTRIVGVASEGEREWLCVAPVTGGPCEPILGSVGNVDRTGWASWQWAPDDTSIRSSRDGGPAALLSPDGDKVRWPPWAELGAESWQRRAP